MNAQETDAMKKARDEAFVDREYFIVTLDERKAYRDGFSDGYEAGLKAAAQNGTTTEVKA